MLSSVAKHYGNEEVVSSEREQDVKGYSGNSFV